MNVEPARIGELLTLRRKLIEPDLNECYVTIGVRSFGRGIFHYDPKLGSELGRLRFFEVQPDQLVISNIKAWEGAVAVSSDDDQGCLASNRFLLCAPIDESRIDVRWARWFLLSRRGNALLQRASPGSADRNRTLGVERFEDLTIPLPPIETQREVAGRLQRISSMATTTLERSKHADLLSNAFGVSLASRPDLSDSAKRRRGWHREPLDTVVQASEERVEVQFDGSYPNVGIYNFGRGLFAKPPIRGDSSSAKELNRIRAGQFIYSRLFAFEGAYAAVGQEFDGRYVSNEFPAFDVDPKRLDARWLAVYLRSPDRWMELARKSRGLGVRRQRVSVASVLDYEIWLPPLEEQRAIVRLVDEIEATRSKRKSAIRMIEALTPASINRAFDDVECR